MMLNFFRHELALADFRAMAAEFVATTLFCYVGCGVAVSTQVFATLDSTGNLDNAFLMSVPLAFGSAITVLAYTVAPWSGAHMNPAVTFAFWLLQKMNVVQFMQYVVAQMLGAVLGVSLVWGTFQIDGVGNPPFLLGSNSVHPHATLGSAFLGEVMGTFLLVWTVLMTAVNSKSMAGNVAPIAIGWSVMLAHLLLIPITGCGINPARSFGSHLVSLCAGEKVFVNGWWIFYSAPFVGSALAVALCVKIFQVSAKTQEDKDDDAKPEQPL